jgi:hypothetical protein
MSMCAYSVFVLFRVYLLALRRADLPSKESHRLSIHPSIHPNYCTVK